jgi:hypothetical protein
MALLAGTIVFADLRGLGFRIASQSAEELDRIFRPWAHSGIAILLTTGALMSLADWERYRLNAASDLELTGHLRTRMKHDVQPAGAFKPA